MNPGRIGILGGMGPEATILLMRKVIEAVPAEDDADHVPLLVDQNPQVPSRIAFLLDGRGADPGPVLAAMARGLERAGAEAIAMPCNTAHHFAAAIRAAIRVPFLDMTALAAARAARLARGSRVGVLGSPALRRTGVFEPALAAVGARALYAHDEDALLAAIREIKRSGPTEAARETLRAASAGLVERGAVVQMVACTEFSLIAEAVDGRATAFDTLDALVEEIVAVARAPRTTPERPAAGR